MKTTAALIQMAHRRGLSLYLASEMNTNCIQKKESPDTEGNTNK